MSEYTAEGGDIGVHRPKPKWPADIVFLPQGLSQVNGKVLYNSLAMKSERRSYLAEVHEKCLEPLKLQKVIQEDIKDNKYPLYELLISSL